MIILNKTPINDLHLIFFELYGDYYLAQIIQPAHNMNSSQRKILFSQKFWLYDNITFLLLINNLTKVNYGLSFDSCSKCFTTNLVPLRWLLWKVSRIRRWVANVGSKGWVSSRCCRRKTIVDLQQIKTCCFLSSIMSDNVIAKKK